MSYEFFLSLDEERNEELMSFRNDENLMSFDGTRTLTEDELSNMLAHYYLSACQELAGDRAEYYSSK